MIVVAGANGDLGFRIVSALQSRKVEVRALTRRAHPGLPSACLVRYDDKRALVEACRGATCIVSAMLGLHDVMVDAQTQLLDAAVEAGVPRFIPSDFAADFTKLPWGRNRNFDLHREFEAIIDRAPIKPTSILTGAFMDLLEGKAPIVIPAIRAVICWESAENKLDFTTRDDAAAFTAEAALDDTAPRFLRVSGDQLDSRELAEAATVAWGKKFRVVRVGSADTLGRIASFVRGVSGDEASPFPAWQGMQYSRDMFEGAAVLQPLDNERYPLRYTKVREYLTAFQSSKA